MTQKINELLVKIKQEKPFILNISDYFPMDLVAGGVRSLGAYPIISNAKEEIKELLGLSKSVVINLGKLDKDFIALCNIICLMANDQNIPIILDPVGAGASQYRTDTAIDLITQHKISIVRGYPNEITSMLTGQLVIANHDLIESDVAIENVRLLSEKYNTAVVSSGKKHWVLDANQIHQFNFDSILLQKVAGVGSLLSSIIGVFHSVEKDRYIAAQAAVNFYANCVGPISCTASGPASLITALIDQLYINSAKATFF